MDLEDRMDVVDSAMSVMQSDIAIIRSNYVTRGEFEVLTCKVEKLQATSASKEELARLSAKVDVIASNYVTREHLAQVINTMTWKIYGFATVLCSGLVAATFFIARTVH